MYLIAALGLSLLTVAIHRPEVRFAPLVEVKFKLNSLAGLTHSKDYVRVSRKGLSLTKDEPSSSAYAFRVLKPPRHAEALKVRWHGFVDVKQVGEFRWIAPRVIGLSYELGGRAISQADHHLGIFYNYRGAVSVERILPLPYEAGYVRLGPQILKGAAGQIRLRDISVIWMKDRSWIVGARSFVAVGWVLYLIALTRAILPHLPMLLSRTVVLVFAGSAFLLAAPGAIERRFLTALYIEPSFITKIIWRANVDWSPSSTGVYIDMSHVVHAGVFLCLSAALSRMMVRAGWSALQIILAVLVIALSAEVAQHFISGRSPNLPDYLANTVGACTGMALTYLWLRFFKLGNQLNMVRP
ncbi:MAG: VanZ family protein [Pseudomonadota bacterium]